MIRRVVVGVVLAGGLLMFAAGTASAVDCTTTPDDPSCSTATPTDAPSPTDTATPTAEPSPSGSPSATATATATDTATATPAPGVDSGVYVDPATGSVRVDQNTGVALGVAAWLGAVVAGLGTAKLVLP